MKNFPTLYKYTTKGQIQEWSIYLVRDQFFTKEGIQGGKLTTSSPTLCLPKNIGKTNETTGEEQALKEAQAKWDKKVASGYNEVLTKEKKFLEPMLAFEYDKYPIDFSKEMVYVQPKLDGVRCINENNTQTSRNGKPLVSTPHLNQSKITLDGELYTHEYKDNFNEIISLVRRTKPSEDELKESAEKIQYWVYDTPMDRDYITRRAALVGWYYNLPEEDRNKFILVPTHRISSEEELLAYHSQFLSEGYEGTIVRRMNMPYEYKRSKQLLKYKDFVDEEFIITGYEEGSGSRANSLGAFHLADPNNPGIYFKSNVKGTFDFLKEIWDNKETYIGATATVKYFQRTPDNIPRFPYIIKLKREDYE
jgi:DNA ligase-1